MNSISRIITTTPIVHTEGNRVFATSKDVAAYFEKRHDHVFASISLLVAEGVPNFRVTPYVHAQNGQTYHVYEMDRDGFTLLAMGFTGPKALKFKLAYIAAFNEALERLKGLETAKPVAPTLPNFADPIAAARAWADAMEEAKLAERLAAGLAGPALIGGIIGRTGRPLRDVASFLPHLNITQVGNDLCSAGYLKRHPQTQVLRVVGNYRDSHFAPVVVLVKGKPRRQIVVCEKGYEVLVKLYVSGRLTMKVGFASAWKDAVPTELLKLLKGQP